MSGQGVGGEPSKEKGLNSGNKACCSGWEGPPLPSRVFILMTVAHISVGLTDAIGAGSRFQGSRITIPLMLLLSPEEP